METFPFDCKTLVMLMCRDTDIAAVTSRENTLLS